MKVARFSFEETIVYHIPLVKKLMGALQKYQDLVFLCSCVTALIVSYKGARRYEGFGLYNAGSTLQTMATRPDVSNGLVSGCRICCLIPGIAPHWFPAHKVVSSALQPTSTGAALMKNVSNGERLKSRLMLQSHINTQNPAASSVFWCCFLFTKEKNGF